MTGAVRSVPATMPTSAIVSRLTVLIRYLLTKKFICRLYRLLEFSLSEYSGSWYECPRVLKLIAQFVAGRSKWFKACVGAHTVSIRDASVCLSSDSSLSVSSRCLVKRVNVKSPKERPAIAPGL